MSEQPDNPTSADPAQPMFPHVTVQLTGTDGNVYAIIGTVMAVLRREVGVDAAQAFNIAATCCRSYDEVLALVMNTVDVR